MPSSRPAATPTNFTSGRRHTAFFRLTAVLLAVVVALLLAELGLRVLGIRPERYPAPRWLAWDGREYREPVEGEALIKRASRFADQGVKMGEYVPGAKFKVVYGSNPHNYFDADGGVPLEANGLGLRGPEVNEEKPDGVRRILILGDSLR